MKIVLIKDHQYGTIGSEIDVTYARANYLILVGVAKFVKPKKEKK